jgi:hypothetical protein
MRVDDSATILLSVSSVLGKAGYTVAYKFVPIFFLTTDSQVGISS